jgi:general nucleoside transport system ATP-binding protein
MRAVSIRGDHAEPLHVDSLLLPRMNDQLAIRITDVAKSFGPVRANRAASLEVRAGEIHALVGENGAGKSTLMRMLAGMYAPDAGTIEVLGRDVTGWDTNAAIAAGVGMVHQHFMLVPTLTVAENVILGRELTRGRQLDLARAEREVRELAERTGLRVDAGRKVAELSVGEAQRVEILKVLWRGAKVLVLDEPTAVLSPPEVDELWQVLRGLRAGGDTIVLITHKLDEVMEISDAITVMRAGKTIDRLVTRETTPAAIAKAMVGREVSLGVLDAAAHGAVGAPAGVATGSRARTPAGGPPPDNNITPAGLTRGTTNVRAVADAPALTLRDLVVAGHNRPRAVDGVSLELRPGEILGIAGVEGNGQTELLEAVSGLRAPASGHILLGATDITTATVKQRAAAGLSHVPEDRHRRGLVLDYSIAENLILGEQDRFTGRRGALDFARVAEHARRQVSEFDIRPADPSLPARALSGGNQQKIVIAREMGRDFSVLLAAQPTRGVDVGAIEFIHGRLRAARDAGKAVLLVSAELNEILALADRIAVMYGGRIVAVLPRAEASEEVLGPYMTGARSAA